MVPTPPGPDTRAPLPHTLAELRALVRDLAEREAVPFTVALWWYRAYLQGWLDKVPADTLPAAYNDVLSLLALVDRELFRRDGWRPTGRGS